jgi:hypothetical protein
MVVKSQALQSFREWPTTLKELYQLPESKASFLKRQKKIK